MKCSKFKELRTCWLPSYSTLLITFGVLGSNPIKGVNIFCSAYPIGVVLSQIFSYMFFASEILYLRFFASKFSYRYVFQIFKNLLKYCYTISYRKINLNQTGNCLCTFTIYIPYTFHFLVLPGGLIFFAFRSLFAANLSKTLRYKTRVKIFLAACMRKTW